MSGGFGYDPSFRPPQYAQQNGVVPSGALEQGIPEGESVTQNGETATLESSENAQIVNGASTEDKDKPVLPASIPQKPVTATAANGSAATPIVRSASQPGVQRVHANGFTSRSHSPAPSNVSFHGNGHPRRAGGVRAPYNGTRSASTQGESRSAQRVPGADDFPALGGMGGSVQTSPRPDADKWDGKTAAQVLSAPAPEKPKATPEVSESGAEAPNETQAADSDAQSVKSEAVSDDDI